MTRAKTWINHHLRCEFTVRMLEVQASYQGNISASVGKLEPVKAFCKAVSLQKGYRAEEGMLDLMADINRFISLDQMEQLLVSCMLVTPRQPKMYNKSPLLLAMMGASFTELIAVLGRGEDCYRQLLRHVFVSHIHAVGSSGMMVQMIQSNRSKNFTGRTRYTGILPHLNPLFCAAAWKGLYMQLRYMVFHECFPDLTEPATFWSIPSYRAVKSSAHSINAKDFADMFRSAYDSVGIDCSKLTHQPRLQGAQELDNAGVPLSDNARMTGHGSRGASGDSHVQLEYYVNNPPLTGMLQRAGGDYRYPSMHQPPRTLVEPPASFYEAMSPGILANEQHLQTVYNRSSATERKTKCLYAANAFLMTHKNSLRRMFQMLASRAVNPLNGALLNDSETFLERFRHGTFKHVLWHPLFGSPGWLEFQRQVRQAEDSYYSGIITIPPNFNASSNYIIQYGNAQTRMMDQRLQSMQAMMSAAFKTRGGEQQPQLLQTPNHMHASACTRITPVATELANGRKKRKAIPTSRVEQNEGPMYDAATNERIPRPHLTDEGEKMTMADHRRLYFEKWKPLEDRFGERWRVDVWVDGQKANSKNMWWSARIVIYRLIAYLEERHGRVKGLELAEEVYDSARTTPGKNPTLRDLRNACRAALNDIAAEDPTAGTQVRMGRRKGSRKKGTRRRPLSDPSSFQMAFANVPVNDTCFAQADLEWQQMLFEHQERSQNGMPPNIGHC